MNRTFTALFVLASSTLLAACGANITGGLGYTKDEARAAGGVDARGNDICAAEGWYGDGTCDDFCQKADPDCPVTNQCPDEANPAVHYASRDYQTCMLADLACAPEQTPFSQPECGCGCIDTAPSGKSCGGFAGFQCNAGFFCSYAADAMCGAGDQMGTCLPVPEACPEYWGPVCGCDGITYPNSCFANAAGVSVAATGECGATGQTCGGFPGTQCPKGEFCSYAPDAICGAADATGTCAPIPGACDLLWAPVCGCDGITYSNECAANLAGVSAATQGECKGAGQMCGGIAAVQCPSGEFCDYAPEAICGADDSAGTCKTIPDVCDTLYAPVCGCDGKTYSNACEANMAGVSVATDAACPAI